ncbi:sure-like protein [Crucibulum laeve]|uniref:Sure-like protein n=1 Tax=Crucibulum laeve TaxID=68775 RepID=A0A5C3LWT8_9AGAR|nr:sure-like protein [Crucibulum laeve]
MRTTISLPIILTLALRATHALKIVLTNDDGWATAQVRAEFDALQAAGFQVLLSAPAINKSGTGSSTATPTVLSGPCEFNTCASGSPATGFNASNPLLNYVNSFPVDSVRFGIQTLAPKLFGSAPDLIVSGSNIGTNLGSISGSGTVGAASEAALEGFPSIAFSGSTGSQVSYTTLQSDPNSSSTLAAHLYTSLIIKFVNALVATPTPFLPKGVSLNVNFAATTSCPSASSFKFILTRVAASSSATDVATCGATRLPDETSTVKAGCFVSVSVFNATTKMDVSAATQAVVLNKLSPILSCRT